MLLLLEKIARVCEIEPGLIFITGETDRSRGYAKTFKSGGSVLNIN